MLVERPPLLGGAALLAGWLAATLRKDLVVDDAEAVAALRAEQRSRLRRLARGASVPPDPAAAVPALVAVPMQTKTR
jgi:hypothetical protein